MLVKGPPDDTAIVACMRVQYYESNSIRNTLILCWPFSPFNHYMTSTGTSNLCNGFNFVHDKNILKAINVEYIAKIATHCVFSAHMATGAATKVLLWRHMFFKGLDVAKFRGSMPSKGTRLCHVYNRQIIRKANTCCPCRKVTVKILITYSQCLLRLFPGQWSVLTVFYLNAPVLNQRKCPRVSWALRMFRTHRFRPCLTLLWDRLGQRIQES